MQSPLTLHDFVTNLLCDADARAAFDLDPDGTLRAAGLGDVTPADVRDVLPLVADYLPAHVTGHPGAGLPELATSALGADRAALAQPLQFGIPQVTAPVFASNPALAAAGSLGGVASGATGVLGTAPVLTGALHSSADFSSGTDLSGSACTSDQLSAGHDPAGTLDAGVSDATGALTGTAGSVPDTLGSLPDTLGTVHDTLGTVQDTLDTVHGTVGGTVGGALGGALGGPLDGLGHAPLGAVTGTLDSATHGLTGGHVLDHTAGGLLGGADPLGLGGTHADSSGSAHAAADPHLIDDLPHLF